MLLSEIQEDSITELLNIGMGVAASSLSELVCEEVILSVPSIEYLTLDNAAAHIRSLAGNEISGVREVFEGIFCGDALLLFPETKSLELVRILLKDEDLPLDTLLEMEQEALLEVGNIILNACIATLANVFEQEITCQLPQYVHGSCESVLGFEGPDQKAEGILMYRMDFSLRDSNIRGYLTLTMGIESIEAFKTEVDKFINSYTETV